MLTFVVIFGLVFFVATLGDWCLMVELYVFLYLVAALETCRKWTSQPLFALTFEHLCSCLFMVVSELFFFQVSLLTCGWLRDLLASGWLDVVFFSCNVIIVVFVLEIDSWSGDRLQKGCQDLGFIGISLEFHWNLDLPNFGQVTSEKPVMVQRFSSFQSASSRRYKILHSCSLFLFFALNS